MEVPLSHDHCSWTAAAASSLPRVAVQAADAVFEGEGVLAPTQASTARTGCLAMLS